jgi:hypothetical protein
MTGAAILVPATITGALLAGMLFGLPRVLQGPLAKRLGKPENQTRGLQGAFHFIQIPILLASGFLLDQWGIQEVVLLGSLILAVGAAFLAESRSLPQVGLAILLMSAGGANLLTGSCVLLALALPENLFPALYWGTVFLTLGAVLLPKLVDRLVRRFGLRQSLLGIALATLIPGVLATFLPGKLPPDAAPGPERALDSAIVWLTGVTVLCYLSLLGLLAGRANLYLGQAGHRPSLVSALVACFWLVFLGTRIACGVLFVQVDLIAKDPEPWIIMLLALAVAIDLGNMAGSDNARGAGVGFLIAGACLGPILPTALGLLFRLFPTDRGMACGVLWSLGMLGWLLATWFQDRPAGSRPDSNLLRAPLILTLILTVSALVLVLVIPLRR